MIDTSGLVKSLKNTTMFGQGYIDALQMEHEVFLMKLSAASVRLLYSYLDNRAKMSPETLHHVYEQDRVGEPSARLFKFNTVVVGTTISITGTFLDAKESRTGQPFVKKAEVMEAGTTITISPRDGGVLVFEDGGETVFTSSTVTVEHPGGPLVEKAFAEAVYDFFASFLTKAIMFPVLQEISNNKEFDRNFARGVKFGYSAGIDAGRKQMRGALNELI